MKLIIVTGMPGAGKEEFLNVAIERNIPFLRMGDFVRGAYPKRSEEDKNLTMGQFASKERERYGYNIWAKRALETMSGDIYLVDGCRSLDEVKAYKELSKDVTVVAIHTPSKIRYERLVKRNREDAPKSLEEFVARDEREMGWGLSDLIALSDNLIVNDGTLEEFKQKSAEFLDRMSN